MNDKTKIVGYQGLRGIAFLMIFISHCILSVIEQGKNATTYFGALGVSLFIVLSGFLTVYNHFDCNELSTKEQITKTIKKVIRYTSLHFYWQFLFLFRNSLNQILMHG